MTNLIRVLALAGAALLALLLSAASADASQDGLQVTIAARVCPSYTSITANRARNDIQESLRDLGADTPYKSGQAIDARIEADNQPNCRPIENWRFSLGTGYKTRAVAGPWGSLSIVTNPLRTNVATQSSVPELNPQGNPTGKDIEGAVTIQLTDQEARLASQKNRLWIQGGTPTDPILNADYPGAYGFGALRCAIDNLNGDNVEWIGYPSNTKHVFCYAYYVSPPPTSGTITIRKEVENAPGANEDFLFGGNLSFSPTGEFTLGVKNGAPAQQDFIRAEAQPGQQPWVVNEQIPPGWELSDIQCDSPGGSVVDIDSTQARVAISLKAADHVTCTYSNKLEPKPGALTLRKVTTGGLGSFDFKVEPEGGGPDETATATTTEEGVAALAEPGPMELKAGRYTISEQAPDSAAGRWALKNVECDGEDLADQDEVTVEIREGEGTICTYTNDFTPKGELKIRKETRGGVGTAGFLISSENDPALQLYQTATTTKQNEPVLAKGDSTDDLDLGKYVIQETAVTTGAGNWALTGLECNGKKVDFSSTGKATVELTRNDPRLTCDFVNTFTPALEVTLAARVCPDYTSITANRARNDIQESLRDLGPDSPYKAGQAIDPKVEADNQPDCRPITGWGFSLGDGYKSRAVSGTWGSLSIVQNPIRTDIATKASTPLLDNQGVATGRQLNGAVTIDLTEQEAALAAKRGLWVQGGTPTDPVLDSKFPGQYGFGALRCAIDNVNGDNVEWIGIPAGVRHVFCYAYYVSPPPTSGTITIRKEVENAPGTTENFPFTGNLSYSPGGDFLLGVKDAAPAEEDFIRAETTPGSDPWVAREELPPGWELADLSCDSAGGSKTDVDKASGRVSISLAAGDHVTCTYVNSLAPEPGALTLRKVSEGALDSFDFEVEPVGGGKTEKLTAETTQEGVAALAEPGPLELRPGTYKISEELPDSQAGRWKLKNVECDGEDLADTDRVRVEIRANEGTICTYTNDFTPRGELKIRKETRGGVGTAGFLISSESDPALQLYQTATTTEQSDPVAAKGDSTDDLELGKYVVQESQVSGDAGTWELTALECNGKPVTFSGGQATIELTRNDPKQTCAFVNSRSDDPQPRPTNKRADLKITKRVRPTTAEPGQTLHYTIVVENLGPDRADDVYVQDLPGGPARVVSVDSRCSKDEPIVCSLGSIKPGHSKELKISLKPKGKGKFVNRAAVSSSTTDPRPGNNQHEAVTDIAKQKPPDPCLRPTASLFPRC